MPQNDKILESIRLAFAPFPNVIEKKMFGKLAFLVNDKLCITVGKEAIMCRINPLLHDLVLNSTICEPVIMRGKEMKGYLRIKTKDLKEEKLIAYWINLCVDYNAQLLKGSG